MYTYCIDDVLTERDCDQMVKDLPRSHLRWRRQAYPDSQPYHIWPAPVTHPRELVGWVKRSVTHQTAGRRILSVR